MSRNFNGSSDRLTSTTPPITGYPFSLALWFNPDTLSTTNKDLWCIDINPTVASAIRLVLRNDTSPLWKLALMLYDGTYKEAFTTAAATTGAWQLATIVCTNATTYAVYLNGANKGTGSTSVSPTFASLNRMAIGGSSFSGADFFDGLIGQVAVYNGVALSDAQVLELYTKGPPLVGSPTTYWTLDTNAAPEVAAIGSNNLTVSTPTYSSSNPSLTFLTLTDVDTDETITADQVNVILTGAGFGASQGTGSVTIFQGAVSLTMPVDSWSDTIIQIDTVIERTGTDLKHGTATARVTTNGGSTVDLAITIVPPTGQLYVDLVSVFATASQRLSSSPDLAIGDQIQVRGLGGGAAPAGLVLNTDGTYYWQAGATPAAFEYRVWDTSDKTWGAWAVSGIADSVPDTFSFPSLVDQELGVLVRSAIVTITGINVPVTVVVDQGEMRINGGPWITGQTTMGSGDTLQLQHATATQKLSSVTTTATIGSITGVFRSTTKDVPLEQTLEEQPTPLPPSESPRPRTIEEAFVIDYGGTPDDITIRLRRRKGPSP